MQELINRLTQTAGISPDQARTAIHTIKDFVKEKFPMMAGAVDNFLPGDSTETIKAGMTQPNNQNTVNPNTGSFMDKISDFIPGETGEKIESFAKNAAGKIGGMMGGDERK